MAFEKAMTLVVLSLLTVVAAFFTQIVIHRLAFLRNRRTLASYIVYPLGLVFIIVVSILLEEWNLTEFLLSSIILYVTVSGIISVFVLTPVMGDRAPTMEIFRLFEKHKKVPVKTIQMHLMRKDFLQKRLSQLQHIGLIDMRKTTYIISSTGRTISRFLGWYRKMF